MTMTSSFMTQNNVVVFDLDDTLYKEVDYLRSAYKEIADNVATLCGQTNVYESMWKWWQTGENVFQRLIKVYHLNMSVGDLLRTYRSHKPKIRLDDVVLSLLEQLKESCVLGMITDGRSETQRHKLTALGIDSLFAETDVLISEETGWIKPSTQPYMAFMERYSQCSYCYIGDNPSKDFFAPNKLGWDTICLLDDGRNIHKQDFSLGSDFLPKYKIKCITELLDIIKK